MAFPTIVLDHTDTDPMRNGRYGSYAYDYWTRIDDSSFPIRSMIPHRNLAGSSGMKSSVGNLLRQDTLIAQTSSTIGGKTVDLGLVQTSALGSIEVATFINPVYNETLYSLHIPQVYRLLTGLYDFVGCLPIDPTGMYDCPQAVLMTPGQKSIGFNDWSAATPTLSSDVVINGAMHIGPEAYADFGGPPALSAAGGPPLSIAGTAYGPLGARIFHSSLTGFAAPVNNLLKQGVYTTETGGLYSGFTAYPGGNPENQNVLNSGTKLYPACYTSVVHSFRMTSYNSSKGYPPGWIAAGFSTIEMRISVVDFAGATVTTSLGQFSSTLYALAADGETACTSIFMSVTAATYLSAGSLYYYFTYDVIIPSPTPFGYINDNIIWTELFSYRNSPPVGYLPVASLTGSAWWPGVAYKIGQF